MRHSSCFFYFCFFFFILSFGRANFRAVFARKGRGGDAHYRQSPLCLPAPPALFACGDVVVQVGNVRDIQFTVDCLPRHTRREPPTKSSRKYTKNIFIFFCVYYVLSTRSTCHTVVDRCKSR